jgi:hypothetical protein
LDGEPCGKVQQGGRKKEASDAGAQKPIQQGFGEWHGFFFGKSA